MSERSDSISLRRDGYTDIGRNQCRFELFEKLFIDDTAGEESDDVDARLGEAAPQLREPPAIDGVGLSGAYHASDAGEADRGALQTERHAGASTHVSFECNKAGSHTDDNESRPAGRAAAGAHHRRRLETHPAAPSPNVPGLRPTPDRVRETLFNWLHASASESGRHAQVSICSPAREHSGSNWPPAVRVLSLWSSPTTRRWRNCAHCANGWRRGRSRSSPETP